VQPTIAASSDARHAPPMARDVDMWLALDDVRPADLQWQADNAATAVGVGHLVVPVALNPAGIVVTACPPRRGSFWE